MYKYFHFAHSNCKEEHMKELMMVVGFGAGLVAGALLYKHSQEAKNLVNKGEKAVKKEVENMKEMIKQDKKPAKTATKN